MNCNEIDVKGYFLDELAPPERARADQHMRDCAACGEELDRLRITQAALYGARDEEIPRRIVFAADAPAPAGWWRSLWNSGPRLGFASAAMLSAAILVHAFAAGPSASGIDARVEAAVARIQADHREEVAALKSDIEWLTKTVNVYRSASFETVVRQ
jgi:anti-sigma factor RsiW